MKVEAWAGRSPEVRALVELAWKVRVALLWVFLGVAQVMAMALFVYEPGSIKTIVRGDALVVPGDPATEWGQLAMALAVLLPLAMAFLTLVLSGRVNRWANGALGLLWTVTAFFLMLQQLGDAADLVITALFLLAAVVLLWHVWAWPRRSSVLREDDEARRQAQTPAGRGAG